MFANRLMILGAVLASSASAVYAAPCNMASRDAGSGNVPGYTGQPAGSTATDSRHPPTSVMNKASENVATSSQDAQRQMQSEPTAAEQPKKIEPAPSSQSPDRTAGTVEQTRPAPTEQSKKLTAGEAEQAPSQQKVGQDCD
ncbi:ABC-type Na+ efflux pump permease subunit [Bradyrhizobium sp. LA8.1]